MKSPWARAIITDEDQQIIEASFNRLTLTLLMIQAVVTHIPEYLDAKFGHVEGS